MLLTNARRKARTGPNEEMIPLDRQDRTLWDQSEIFEGIALITAALSRGSISAYQLQAAIAAVHAEAAKVEDTDWPQILTLYELLKRMSGNPMVALNHAVASGYGERSGRRSQSVAGIGPRWAAVPAIIGSMQCVLTCWRCPATQRARLFTSNKLAAERTTSLPERNYLLTQIARLSERTLS